MTKIERFLKMAQATGQLKKLRWQEEDRRQAQEEREEALKYMTPFEHQLFQKGKLPEGMGKEKGEEGEGLFPSLETIYGEKPVPKGLFGRGAETRGALRQPTARIQETLKQRELHPLEKLEAEPKTAREWAQRQMLISGLPFEEMGAEQRFVGGTLEKQPYEYEHLTPEEIPKASRVRAGLEARATEKEGAYWKALRGVVSKPYEQLSEEDRRWATALGYKYNRITKEWKQEKDFRSSYLWKSVYDNVETDYIKNKPKGEKVLTKEDITKVVNETDRLYEEVAEESGVDFSKYFR